MLKTKFRFITIIILIIGIFMFMQSVQGEEIPLIPVQITQSKEGFFPPDTVKDSQEQAQNLIDTKSDLEEDMGPLEGDDSEPVVSYGPDGWIANVVEPDGTSTAYSYEIDAQGNVNEASLLNKDTEITFTESYISIEDFDTDEEPVSARDIEIPTPSGEDDRVIKISESSNKNDGVIKVVPMPEEKPIDLKRIATEGVDFKAIKKVFDDLDEKEEEARKEFYDATEPYYDKLESELKETISLWNGADMDLLNDENKRKTIEEAVEYIYAMVPESDAEKEAKEKIINLEAKLKLSLILPNIERYKALTKEAIETFQRMVEFILGDTAGASFVNDGEKIEAIIIFPSDDKEGEEPGEE